MRENVDQNNSEYEHFSRSENYFAVVLAFTEQNMNFQNFSWAWVPSKKSPQFAFFFQNQFANGSIDERICKSFL